MTAPMASGAVRVTSSGGVRALSLAPRARSMVDGLATWIEDAERPAARAAGAEVNAFLDGLSQHHLRAVLRQLDREPPASCRCSRAAAYGALCDRLIVPTSCSEAA